MVTTPYPTRIYSGSCSPLHIQQELQWLMLTTLQAFIQEKRRLKKIKLRRKRLSFPKVWECFLHVLFFLDLNQIFEYWIFTSIELYIFQIFLTIHIIIITCSASLRFCFFKNKKIQFWIVSIPWVVSLTLFSFTHKVWLAHACRKKVAEGKY